MTRLTSLAGSGRPLVMGILNVTPDSFSDGGLFLDTDKAVQHARRMIAEGADIIDVGGESTRPGAAAVSASEELDRVLPVIRAIRSDTDALISLDTSKPEVIAEAATEIDLVNDVRALRAEGALECMRHNNLPVCLMHMQGEPRTMQDEPRYQDVVGEVHGFFEQRITACEGAGIARDRLILDIGFGFGKTIAHNLTLINQLNRFLDLGLPLLVGLSRKSTIGTIVEDRLIGSVAGALFALQRGASILRVHDVRETVTAISVWRSFAEARIVLPAGERDG